MIKQKKYSLINSSDDGLPKIKVSKKMNLKIKIYLILILSNKIRKFKSEIKRLIKNNGIKINNIKIEENSPISKIKFKKKNYFKLSIGKKKHFKIEFN